MHNCKYIQYSLRFGCTKIVISDQGREFVNRVSQDLFALTKTILEEGERQCFLSGAQDELPIESNQLTNLMSTVLVACQTYLIHTGFSVPNADNGFSCSFMR